MRINQLAKLHQKVIHSPSCTAKELEQEELWVKKYPYDSLESVCSDCFRNPDADITPNDLVYLKGMDVKYFDQRNSLSVKQINRLEI